LWLANPSNTQGATPNEFFVEWEGQTLDDRINIPFTNGMNLQYTVTATSNGSRLEFGFRDDPFYLGLDDVSVKPIPSAPSLRAITQKKVAPTANNFSAFNPHAATFHAAFAVTAGQTYQIQCKTNLAQPDWTDLGAPIAATSDTLNFSDPDTASSSQKFYRLKLLP
jgi:hypothetical protein